MSDSHIGAVLAVGAAVLFAIGMQLTQLGLRSIDSQRGTLLTIGSSTLLYWLAAPWYLKAEYWASWVTGLYVVVGLFRPFLSSNFSIAGTARLGPTISSTLSATAPFFGLVFGVALLGEDLTASVAVGTAAIVGGVMLLAWRRGAAARFDWPRWAIVLPIAAAVIRVAAHLLAKIGMQVVPSAYYVGLVSYSASLAVAVANNARRRTPLAELAGKPDTGWFLLTGVFYGAAVLTLNVALQRADLSVVAPIVSAEPIFVLLLGALVFRERALSRRVVAAVLLVVAGVVVITLRA